MKHLILISFLFAAASAQAQQKQSLKDLLYGGKLKKDSSGVIHSTDDLSTKIDTTTKKEPEVVKAATPAPVTTMQPGNKPAVQKTDVSDAAATATEANSTATPAAPAATAPAKTNTKLWKEYTDSLTRILQTDVLRSKQVKKDTYFLLAEYELAPDGQVTITNVTSTPENAYLQAQVKQIMDSMPLRLNPTGDTSNPAKKLKRRQQITVTKD